MSELAVGLNTLKVANSVYGFDNVPGLNPTLRETGDIRFHLNDGHWSDLPATAWSGPLGLFHGLSLGDLSGRLRLLTGHVLGSTSEPSGSVWTSSSPIAGYTRLYVSRAGLRWGFVPHATTASTVYHTGGAALQTIMTAAPDYHLVLTRVSIKGKTPSGVFRNVQVWKYHPGDERGDMVTVATLGPTEMTYVTGADPLKSSYKEAFSGDISNSAGVILEAGSNSEIRAAVGGGGVSPSYPTSLSAFFIRVPVGQSPPFVR